MGELQYPAPALLLMAAFSRHGDALDWAKSRAEQAWGPVVLESHRFAFTETEYYHRSMGADLLKTFFAFQRPFDCANLADCKHLSNSWEEEYRASGNAGEERPLNLDPGYLTQAKLVLATTKDRDHRIYLRDGIFAEVTLHYQKGLWMARPWTYPDYQRSDFHVFFTECRQTLRNRLAGAAGGTGP